MVQIETERLQLRALSVSELVQLLSATAVLETALGVAIAPGVLTPPVRRAGTVKLLKMGLQGSAETVWMTYWLILLNAHAIGLIGFKGAPDANGEVEIGYGLDESYWGHGYATEAATALVQWAFSHPACRAILADVNLNNPASARVLKKCHFEQVATSAKFHYFRLDRESAT